MSLKKRINVRVPFNGGNSFGATVDANGWKGTIVKTSGSPSAACIGGGGVKLLTDSTSEAQSVSLTNADVLPYPSTTLQRFEFELNGLSLASATHTTYAAGLGTALNTTYASMTNYILFVCAGTNDIKISASDGTNVYAASANDSLQNLNQTFQFVAIDLSNGLGDVRFYIDDGQSLRRVCSSTTFNLSNMTGNLQPVFINVKTSSADVAGLTIRNLDIDYKAN